LRRDRQLTYVSVDLASEMALLADSYHPGDSGLANGDQDCPVLSGSGGEGVGKPPLSSDNGRLAIPPGGESFCQPRGELQYRRLVLIGRRANMKVSAIHAQHHATGTRRLKRDP
jgi:hypothetical protein